MSLWQSMLARWFRPAAPPPALPPVCPATGEYLILTGEPLPEWFRAHFTASWKAAHDIAIILRSDWSMEVRLAKPFVEPRK